MAKQKPIRCSYCGVSPEHDRVLVLVSTPDGWKPRAYICDVCVEICVKVIAEKITEDRRFKGFDGIEMKNQGD